MHSNNIDLLLDFLSVTLLNCVRYEVVPTAVRADGYEDSSEDSCTYVCAYLWISHTCYRAASTNFPARW